MIIKSYSFEKDMNNLVTRQLTLIEKAEAVLDSVFGEQKRVPSRYWPEDEEENLESLETICDYKFIAEDLKAMGIKIPEKEIYSRCVECNGHDDRGCVFRPDYYGFDGE